MQANIDADSHDVEVIVNRIPSGSLDAQESEVRFNQAYMHILQRELGLVEPCELRGNRILGITPYKIDSGENPVLPPEFHGTPETQLVFIRAARKEPMVVGEKQIRPVLVYTQIQEQIESILIDEQLFTSTAPNTEVAYAVKRSGSRWSVAPNYMALIHTYPHKIRMEVELAPIGFSVLPPGSEQVNAAFGINGARAIVSQLVPVQEKVYRWIPNAQPEDFPIPKIFLGYCKSILRGVS